MKQPALQHASLHAAIVRHFLEAGVAPSRQALALQFRVEAEEMGRALTSLQEYHGVVLDSQRQEILAAHPFSNVPTYFLVRDGSRSWWANCAWCALGMAGLLGGDGIAIETRLGADGPPLAISVRAGQIADSLLVHFPIPMTRAWENVIYTCSTMLMFDTEAAIEAWCARHGTPRGDTQPVQRVYEFATVWYGRHLDEDWRKWTTEEARAIFARFGFTGPIWQLPASAERF